MQHVATELWSDFPALDLVRSSRFIRTAGRITMVVLVISLIAMLFVPWQQTAPGTGLVMAKTPQERPQSVKSPVKGIVKFVKDDLREGTYVNEGEILLELEPAAEGGVQQLNLQIEAANLKVTAARERVNFAEQQIELQVTSGELMQESLEKDLEAAVAKWEQAKSELAAARSDLIDKQNQRSIAELVYEERIISKLELVTKQQDEETQKRKVEKSEQAVTEAYATLEAKRKEIESKQRDIEIKNRDAKNKWLAEQDKLQSVLNELSDLNVKRQELDRLVIKAPRTGYIQQWFGLEGSETVSEGQPLFVIVPDTENLAVEMVVSGNDMPLVQPGAPVRLQFEGWPAVQFVGWPSVAIGTFGGRVNRVFPTDDGQGNFRVLVVPDNYLPHDNGWPDKVYLRQGVRANGWVLLRQVPLGYEVWRQINGFPPSIADAEDKLPKPPIPKL
jgi:multidrug resistance efflux pump